MRKIGKRIFSFLLCMTMLVGLVVIEPKAADETPVEVNLSTNGVEPDTKNGYWNFTLATDVNLPTSTVDWAQYQELEAYVNGGKVTATFNRAGDKSLNVFIEGSQFTLTPEFGTVLTIKGTAMAQGASTPIAINEFHMAWNGTKLIEVPSTQGTTLNVKELESCAGVGDGALRFWLVPSETMPGNEGTQFNGLTTEVVNGETVKKYTTSVHNFSGKMYIAVWGYDEPQAGDIATLKQGIATNKTDGFLGLSKDCVLLYDGTTWISKYTDVSLSYASASPNTQKNFWEIYLNATSAGPGTAWETNYNELEVQVNGTKVPTQLTKATGQQIGLIVYGDKCSLTPEFGTTITIKAGESQVGEQYLRLTEDCVLEWDGSKWGNYVEGITLTVDELHMCGFQDNSLRFWLKMSQWKVPTDTTTNLTVFVNGKKCNGTIQEDSGFLFLNLWGHTTAPVAGDYMTLKKGIGLNENGNIKIPEDFTLVYTGTEWEEAVVTKPYTSENFATYTKETAPTLSGFVFAGWFTDESCTTPFKDETATGDVYAKFVHEQVLSVQAQISTAHEDDSRDIRFVTTVDSLDYSEVGFEIAFGDSETYVPKASKTVYSSLYAMGSDSAVMSYVPSEVFSPVSEFFNTYAFKNVGSSYFDKDFKVKPYWVTLDGTKVYGTEVTKSISDGIAQE